MMLFAIAHVLSAAPILYPIFVNISYFCSCTKHFERIPYYFKSTETKKQRGIFMMMTCTSVFIIF